MKTNYHLFDVIGVELEYMVVNQQSLHIQPVVADLFLAKNGTITDDIDNGTIAWSNELVAHVVELKTNGPAKDLSLLAHSFHQNILEINLLLKNQQAKLLGTACHPFMNPLTETALWPYGAKDIYQLYDTIFGCKGHGWSNLQSMHLNLPFYNDDEFAKLHAAIRILLPILPGLSASSPILDGQLTGYKDSRLEQYKHNQKQIPIIAGKVIPEAVYSKQAYYDVIYHPIQKAIAPHDPTGILDFHFVNSRGAIARFDRNAIEIRVLDLQECPKADVAIAMLIVESLKLLITQPFTSLASQKEMDIDVLATLLNQSILDAEQHNITNATYLQELGLKKTTTVSGIWKHLYKCVKHHIATEHQETLVYLLENGTLASRITKAFEKNPTSKNLHQIYQKLSSCLHNNQLFDPCQ
ncbi:carboxylate-amine ligase [Ochrovirga pacifica]|uniref:carboxylate-amine ligase n=1 Tax=Ochrovirga pacifica TaxID=1042376 RepID=UPI0002558398|nr:glutamate-cysteine ligase family protein [Ochrovirga pacifica]